jgi:hypothetical protein
LPTVSQTIRTKLKHSNEQEYGSTLFLIDHTKAV